MYFGFGLTTLPYRVMTDCLAPWDVGVLDIIWRKVGTELGCVCGLVVVWVGSGEVCGTLTAAGVCEVDAAGR